MSSSCPTPDPAGTAAAGVSRAPSHPPSTPSPTVSFGRCEVSEWLGAPTAPSPAQMTDLIRAVGPQRVMMGSDFPWYDIDHTVGRVLELPGLSAEEKDG